MIKGKPAHTQKTISIYIGQGHSRFGRQKTKHGNKKRVSTDDNRKEIHMHIGKLGH